jgi:hypothetical protein
MTLGNMRANGVRSLDVCCRLCHHQAPRLQISASGEPSQGCLNSCGDDICSVSCIDGKCLGTCPKCGEIRVLPVFNGVGVVRGIGSAANWRWRSRSALIALSHQLRKRAKFTAIRRSALVQVAFALSG